MREVAEHLPRELFYQYVKPIRTQTVIASRYFGDNDPKHLGSAMVSLRFHPYLSVAPGRSIFMAFFAIMGLAKSKLFALFGPRNYFS